MNIYFDGILIGETERTSEGIWYRSTFNLSAYGFARTNEDARQKLITLMFRSQAA